MINSIDVNLIRRLCDKANLTTRIDDDGDVSFCLDADSDFKHDVFIFFGAENNWFTMRGMSNFLIKQDQVGQVLVKLNEINRSLRFAKVFLADNGRIIAERQELIDEGVSEEFLFENCIKMFPAVVWHLFKDYFGDF